MNREELLSCITIDLKVCFGKPCIRGHRISVSLVLDFLASGMTIEEVLEDYPDINRDDILACIANGAEMSRERYVEIPVEPSRRSEGGAESARNNRDEGECQPTGAR